jgi:hypothetical protein
MGAVVHDTGGILIDHGWLRVLGSGHPRLPRTLPGWNEQVAPDGFYLVADDAVGGFFALNGGAFGPDLKNLYYFAPDTLDWEPMSMGYSDFLQWAFGGKLDDFYSWIRWPGWQTDAASLPGDRCFAFYPFLFTREGQGGTGRRETVRVAESWDLQMDLRKQLGPARRGHQ